MDRINGADTTDIGAGRRGFRDENLVAGAAGTEVTADFLNSIQEEIMALIEASGLAADPASWSQVVRAVRSQKINYFTAGGTANALTITPSPAFAALADLVGVPLRIKSTASNTSTAVTLNVNGLGAVNVSRRNGSALLAGDVGIGINEYVYDGAVFQLSSPVSTTNFKSHDVKVTPGTDTFTAPQTGWYYVKVIGGGGGGGSVNSSALIAACGGGAGVSEGFVYLAAGQVVSRTVGAAGSGGSGGGSPGNSGSASSFGAFLTASGGGGGAGAGSGNGSGGQSGIGSGGTLNYGLGDGSAYMKWDGTAFDGGGLGGGAGAQSSTATGAVARSGQAPGAGGGGTATNGAGGGGPGAAGAVIITW
jgi:hypothetical protein